MLSLTLANYRLDITNAPPHCEGAADNARSYDLTHAFGDLSYGETSRHALHLFEHGELVRSCLFSSDGGASGVHDHTALIHGSNCIIAVGPFVACVAIPSLDLLWVTQTDDATCFGVYDSRTHDCLLSHGELLIARLSHDGTIVWQAGGADIFTNGFQIDDDAILATDFNDRKYKLDIRTGRGIGPGHQRRSWWRGSTN